MLLERSVLISKSVTLTAYGLGSALLFPVYDIYDNFFLLRSQLQDIFCYTVTPVSVSAVQRCKRMVTARNRQISDTHILETYKKSHSFIISTSRLPGHSNAQKNSYRADEHCQTRPLSRADNVKGRTQSSCCEQHTSMFTFASLLARL